MTQDDFMPNLMQDVMNSIKGAKLKIKIVHYININNNNNVTRNINSHYTSIDVISMVWSYIKLLFQTNVFAQTVWKHNST